jgi:hypothetical protein
MKSVAVTAVVLATFAACAQGSSSGDDDDQVLIDAANSVVDGPAAIDAPAVIDAPIDASVPVGNADTCAMAIDITAAAMTASGTTVTGDLTPFGNDIEPQGTCTGFNNEGPDAIYVLSNLAAGRVITASVSAPSWDSAIEIVQPCSLNPTCLVGRDGGDPESVTYTTAAAGTYYVIVDSWDVGSFGPYTLTVRVQ